MLYRGRRFRKQGEKAERNIGMKVLSILLIQTVVLLTGFVPGAQAAQQILLPDLQTLPMFDFRLLPGSTRGERFVYFSNAVINAGEGTLELRGAFDRQDQSFVVTQYMFGLNDSSLTRDVGEFEFHPDHNHWHWDSFALYELLEVKPDGSLGEMVVTSGKVGYCIWDRSQAEAEWVAENMSKAAEIPASREYGQCNSRRQGLSPGWVDTYDWGTPGQFVEVTGLESGVYALRSTVDPEGLIQEANERNNTAVAYLYIEEDHVIVMGDATFVPLSR